MGSRDCDQRLRTLAALLWELFNELKTVALLHSGIHINGLLQLGLITNGEALGALA